MSLFPAYSNDTEPLPPAAPPEETASTSEKAQKWLENRSFPLAEAKLKEVQTGGIAESQSSSAETISDSDDSSESGEPSPPKKSKKSSKRLKKKAKRHTEEILEPPLEFVGDEEYYVDKAPARQYKTILTLHRPACPRYHRSSFRGKMGWICKLGIYDSNNKKKNKRYYRHVKKSKTEEQSTEALTENEYTDRQGDLNRQIMKRPNDLQSWLDLIQLQNRNPYKWSRLLLAEKKLDVIQRGLVHMPRNDSLYRLYIETVSATYPSFEVSKMFDRLLAKDPYNYTLWTAQIMTTQGSMARCLVPDVLRIYERCMQRMHHAQKESRDASNSDEVMLKLFNNCALFLRQAGLYEQFVALVKLALELNVSPDKFGNFAPDDADQRALIEYEEIILQSGLPMNEIWLRIEKLRQGFNFLPVPVNAKCSDPQRIVFNQDVCHYIYPLKSRENSYYLVLLILRLFKLPFVQCDGLAEKFSARVEHFGDSDAIEDLLAVCIRRSFALPQQQQDTFISSLYELTKEMAVSPTFLSNTIGHEIYTRSLSQLIINCANAHEGIDERRRISFLMLWCRFERLLLILQKCARKLTPDYVRAGRSRFKALLKQKANRNVSNLYTEFGIYEFEALQSNDDLEPVQKIFDNLIAANASNDEGLNSDMAYLYVTYAEILIGRGKREEAVGVLASYALGGDVKDRQNISTTRKLVALQRLIDRLDAVIEVERNVEIMVLEQYLLPDFTVSLLKMRILMQYLVGQTTQAIAYLEKLLNIFKQDSDRHGYLRELIQELHLTLIQLPAVNCVSISYGSLTTQTFRALSEFPRNLFILQCCCMLSSSPWYKLRSAMLRYNPSISSVVFLIVLARCRFIQRPVSATAMHAFGATDSQAVLETDAKYRERIVRNRILHVFQTLAPSTETPSGNNRYSALQRNALYWRLYLRCLLDNCTSFETSRKCLLTALDECPWNKALYMDGATYVPQEMPHLQDLIIEKQLRMCALPEELEILREQ